MSGASERASGRASGPVLYASIPELVGPSWGGRWMMENVGVLRDRTRPFCRLDWFVMISLKSDATFTGSLLLRLFLYPSSLFSLHRSTMVWNKQKSRRKSWATRLSVRSFARTAHSFACSGVLASLAPSAALTRSLARSLRSLPRSWESEFLMSQNDLVLSHSAAFRR